MEDVFDVVIPTGNFGNAYSAFMAKKMGVNIDRITIANNRNHMLADLVANTEGDGSGVIPTLAPSMDIAVPSNLERFEGDLAASFSAGWIDDDQIVATIRRVHSDYGYLLDPHSATAWSVGEPTRTPNRQVVVGTAHPAKFPDAIEAAIGVGPEVPPGWEIDPDLPERIMTIGPEFKELEELLKSG
jgi:threonine synthase